MLHVCSNVSHPILKSPVITNSTGLNCITIPWLYHDYTIKFPLKPRCIPFSMPWKMPLFFTQILTKSAPVFQGRFTVLHRGSTEVKCSTYPTVVHRAAARPNAAQRPSGSAGQSLGIEGGYQGNMTWFNEYMYVGIYIYTYIYIYTHL